MKDGRSRHAAVAEYGKLLALHGDHVNALLHYREAMRMTVQAQAPEVVFRHYLECSLESLEHMGAYGELLEYCDRAIHHYRLHTPRSPLALLDLASIHQRRGIALLKQGARAHATGEFDLACEVARSVGANLLLSETLLRWLKAELTISTDRLCAEQVRHRYFSVRKETVNPARATPLPAAMARTQSKIFCPRGP